MTCRSGQRYLTDTQGIGGTIKARHEDFRVEELTLYEPCGAGEHLYLRIRKQGIAHGELVNLLCRHFHVSPRAVGYAGRKDRQAVTEQTVSIHILEDPPTTTLAHEQVHTVWACRHRNKIRRGHLAGNRFSIKIRDVDPAAAPLASRCIEELVRRGMPAAFGPQRFGYRDNNHLLGLHLLEGAWTDLLDTLLGSRGQESGPEHQQRAREEYDAGHYQEAAACFSTSARAEYRAVHALATGATPEQAVRTIASNTKYFWISALSSSLFNKVLSCRMAEGSMAQLLEGDLAWLHDRRAIFPVTREELQDPELHLRGQRFELSPSGPLWGRDLPAAFGHPGSIEDSVFSAAGLSLPHACTSFTVPTGTRRPLRTPVRETRVDTGSDAHGAYIQIDFTLDRGQYATVLLGEIMKAGLPSSV